MRRELKILVPAAVLALMLAGSASAQVRHGLASAAAGAGHALGVTVQVSSPVPSPAAVPEEQAATPEPVQSPEPAETSGATDLTPAAHGAAVSTVARDADATATWVNPAGKKITNHGKAVAAVAHKQAGKTAKAAGSHGAGQGNGKD